jgi:hypothetical protein
MQDSVHQEGGDRVAAQTAGGRGVEELGVLITLKGVSNLSTGFPVDRAFFDGEVESIHSTRMKVVFVPGEGARFFHNVKEVDKDAAVLLSLSGRKGTLSPPLACDSTETQASDNTGGRIRASDRPPRGHNSGTKTIVKGPGRLVVEKAALGDCGRNGGDKGDMVGSVARKRGECGGGKGSIPRMVDKHAVNSNERRNFSSIGPGKKPIAEWELNKGQIIDAIVKHAGFRQREVTIIPISGVSSEIEITGKDPGNVIVRLVSSKISKESGLLSMVAGSVNVGET